MISIFLEDGKNLQAIYRHINQAMVKKWYIRGISAFPSGEIRPGSLLPAIALGKSGDLTIVPMFWGMTFPPVPGKTTGCFLYEVRTDLPKEKKTAYGLFTDVWSLCPGFTKLKHGWTEQQAAAYQGQVVICVSRMALISVILHAFIILKMDTLPLLFVPALHSWIYFHLFRSFSEKKQCTTGFPLFRILSHCFDHDTFHSLLTMKAFQNNPGVSQINKVTQLWPQCKTLGA